MENSKSLSIESFSYSWLVNLEGSFRSTSMDNASNECEEDHEEEAAFIEMDPSLSPSKRFSNVSLQDLNISPDPSHSGSLVHRAAVNLQDFNFNSTISQLPQIVDADKLMSNGSLMPLLINPTNIIMDTNYPANYADHDTILINNSESTSFIKKQVHLPKLSSGVFQKLLDFLKPFCKKIRFGFGCRNGNSTSTLVQGTMMRNRGCCDETISPRTSLGYSVEDWRRSCDSESSIHEAVLHCKKTINGE